MHTYTIASPSLDGVLSDDYIYFEGVKRPSIFFTLRDSPEKYNDGGVLILEQYFNDMYNLFLRRLTIFASSDPVSDEESLKLQALLQELVKVKSLIENASKTAIMRG